MTSWYLYHIYLMTKETHAIGRRAACWVFTWGEMGVAVLERRPTTVSVVSYRQAKEGKRGEGELLANRKPPDRSKGKERHQPADITPWQLAAKANLQLIITITR